MKRKTKKLIGLGLTALVLPLTGVWLIESGDMGKRSAQNTGFALSGEALFVTNCASCHGVKAVGENPAKLSGGEKEGGGYWAPALNGKAHAWHHPAEALFHIIKKGSAAQDSPMRGFEDRLTDDQIRGVITYIQSLWPKELRERYFKYNQ